MLWEELPCGICGPTDPEDTLSAYNLHPADYLTRLVQSSDSEPLFTKILALPCWGQESTFLLSYHISF